MLLLVSAPLWVQGLAGAVAGVAAAAAVAEVKIAVVAERSVSGECDVPAGFGS